MTEPTPRNTWRDEAERQGVPLAQLAARTGITRRSVYAYSSGARRPSDAWVERVWRVLEALDAARAPRDAA